MGSELFQTMQLSQLGHNMRPGNGLHGLQVTSNNIKNCEILWHNFTKDQSYEDSETTSCVTKLNQ